MLTAGMKNAFSFVKKCDVSFNFMTGMQHGGNGRSGITHYTQKKFYKGRQHMHIVKQLLGALCVNNVSQCGRRYKQKIRRHIDETYLWLSMTMLCSTLNGVNVIEKKAECRRGAAFFKQRCVRSVDLIHQLDKKTNMDPLLQVLLMKRRLIHTI